ncbi:MAG: hypothetical protein KDA88_24110 [Planctomycetaceae bacterium]|nr:hypothetical protein [Planctomycetaceae bacterium]MCB9951907.1 hypothetical protein [Planctomycetaceae bacterium]
MAVEGFAGANRVFISCVSDEFEKPSAPYPGFRSALRDYLTQADCEVKVQEQFRQEGSLDTVEKLAGYIKTCKAVIHLLGEMSGSIAHPQAVAAFLKDNPDFLAKYPELRTELGNCSDLTYTQWEAFLALHYGVDLFVYVTKKGQGAQKPHLDRLKLARKYADEIKSDTDLLGRLIGDLRKIVESNSQGQKKPDIAPSRILRHAPSVLFGREKQLAALDNVWNDGTNVYTLVAWGGVGKTSLVSHWVSEHFAKRGWPGVERYFDWSFYSQGTGESRQTSADLFINKALEFFGDEDPLLGGPWERGERLAKLIRQHRTLLVLDGIEPLQYPVTDKAGQAGRLKDQGLEALIQSLANENPGLCVITTREHLTNIESVGTTKEEKLDKLLLAAAISLLRHLQVVGTEEELEEAWKDAGGHALTLQLLGRFIAQAYLDKDIRHYKQVRFDEADLETQGRSAFKVMRAYERWLKSEGEERQRELAILRLTGLFDRPISPGCLAALRAKPAIAGLTDDLVDLKETQWNSALKRLSEIDLISLNVQPSTLDLQPSLDAHPLVREYFAEQLQREQPEAFRAAHSRLFDHLCETTKPHRPDTLQGLQPLYEAVTHGCLAGRHQEACTDVYRDRILRGTGSGGFYSQRQLGAIGADLGAVAAFFDVPWSQVSQNLQKSGQTWLLAVAAFNLRALGRLSEAIDLIRIGLPSEVAREDWKNAVISAGNLSELEVTLGQLDSAVADGRRAVEFADQTNDPFEKVVDRAILADALHQSGATDEARQLFAEAETIQKKRQPKYPLLYSLPGFRYVDLLLAFAEQAAWRAVLRETSQTNFLNGQRSILNDICDDADHRAKKMFEWRESSDSILGIALDHLSLAWSALFRALLDGDVPETLATHVTAALSAFRKANDLMYLPRALLTAAWYYATLGEQPVEAKRLLDEAEQISKRGPMPLYLADVHLHRARLFRDRDELAKARVLIEKHSYGRRLPELADAEAAAVNW